MNREESGFNRLKSVKRKAIRLSQEQIVKTGYLEENEGFPLVIEPGMEKVNLSVWANGNREYIEEELIRSGAILFRGFDIDSVSKFEQVVTAMSEQPLAYNERSSPRSHVSGNIYTSTDYPPDKAIFLHNEQSYNITFPLRIFFFCLTAAPYGGQTPIADSRKIYRRISPRIKDRFAELGYLYVRNFCDGIGLHWQTAFQTTDKSKVEQYCLSNDIKFEWKRDDGLRTYQVRRAIAKHPYSSDMAWFNHITFFHVSTLDRSVGQTLLEQYGEDDLPNNTYYGDGSRIEAGVLDELREAYLAEKVVFDWQRGDILMLDNMLASHGREPYDGPREVLVAMTMPFRWERV
jgi:alpha-ketoglutarate-dependent taurine dioxygenase